MNTILYIHGWGSAFDPKNEKIQVLGKLGLVFGPTLDYTSGFDKVTGQCLKIINEYDPDLIVGTSLGGYLASHIGALSGKAFVAINPAIDPGESLKKYVGEGRDHTGKLYNLSNDIILDLPKFNMNGCGLILLDKGDDLLDSAATAKALGDRYRVVEFEGGNHRFAHMEESLDAIKQHLDDSRLVYGLDD